MILENVTQKTIVYPNIEIASSFFDQLLGLLQHTKQAMLFYTRFGIHTFGMNRKIDVIVLDQKWKAAKIKKNLPSNSLFFWNPKLNIVIELPSGTINKSKTEIGNVLKMHKK
ncbi:MAG: DUF192 domain-containing protein [Microgenomates group bacterium]